MTFSEPPDPSLSIVHVLDVNAAPVEAGPVEAVPGHGDQLRIALPASLPDGVYTVSWRVVSEADGHATAGAFSFGVNVAPGTVVTPSVPVPTTPSPSVGSVAGKLLLYVGLALSFAAAVVGLLAFGGRVPERKRVLRFAAASAVVGVVTMLLSERATLGVSMGDLLSSATGTDYLWLLGGVTFAAVSALDAARRSDRTSLVVAGVAAAAAMLTRAIGGHAAAAATPALQIGLQWLHFMAASVWMGGLALTFLWLRVQRRTEGSVPVDEVRAYSSLAGYALAVVLVTGVLRATQEVGGLSKLFDLFRGSYGTTLDVKVRLVLVADRAGRVQPVPFDPAHGDAAPGLLRRVMAIELVGAVGVFSLTGMLTGLAPRPPVNPPAPRAGARHAHRQRLRDDHEGHARHHARHRRAERVRRRRHRLRLGRAARRHGRLAAVRARGDRGSGREHAGPDAPRRSMDGERLAGVHRRRVDDHGRRPDGVVAAPRSR